MRRGLWIVWHTRPGHQPWGIGRDSLGVLRCMACMSAVPNQRSAS